MTSDSAHKIDSCSTSWNDTLDRLDLLISSVIQRQLDKGVLRPAHIASGFGELIKMRLGMDLDWSRIGVPAAYVLRYVPHRVAALNALHHQAGLNKPVRRLFDIGSGTDAVAITLALAQPYRPPTLTAVEPSLEMSGMGDELLSGLVQKFASHGTVSDAFGVAWGLYDRVFISKGLGYESRHGDAWWDRFVDGAFRILEPGASLLVAEPVSRAAGVDTLRAALLRHQVPSRTFSSDDYSKVYTQPIELERSTSILKYVVRQQEFRNEMTRVLPVTQQLVGDPVRPVLSWHQGRPEIALVAEAPADD